MMKLIIVFLCSLTLLLLGLDRNVTNVFDEGEILVGAQHVFWGYIPYRDFWTGYGPGQYWAVGSLFKLFGPYILVERIWDIVVRAALATLAYAISRELTSRWISLATWLFSLGWLWVVGFYGYPLLPAAFFSLLSAYFLFKHASGAANIWALFGAGALAGVAILFRHDIGIYTLAAEIAAILVGGPFAVGPGTPVGLVTRGRSMASKVCLLVAGALSVSAPVTAYFILHVPYKDLLHPLVIYPLTIYAPTRSLPFPSLIEPLVSLGRSEWLGNSLDRFSKAFALYFPWIVAGIGVASFWGTPRIAPLVSNNQAKRFAGRLLALLVLTLSLKSMVRPQISHIVHAIVPSFILAGMLLIEGRPLRAYLVPSVTMAMLAVMAYPPIFTAYRVIATPWSKLMLAARSENSVSAVKQFYWSLVERGNGPQPAIFFHIDPDQAAAVSYIRTHTTRDDRLFVGNGRHDLIFFNDVLFYFLAERRPATKYYEFDPGVTTSAEIQAAIIDGIRETRVPYVVRVSRFDAVREPNRSAESSGVVDLDQFLQNNFELVARFGNYEIRKRLE